MSSLVAHSAAGQAAGYFFQIDRMLLRLAQVPEGALVAIEKEDDVSVKYKDGTLLLEQDKHTLGTTSPFGDGSVALWKTLDIWSEAVENGEIDADHCSFFLVTNVEVPDGLAKTLSEAREQDAIDKAFDALKVTTGEISDTTRPYAEKVVARDEEKLKRIIKNIEVVDSLAVSAGPELRRTIRSLLHLPDDLSPMDIINGLHGWLAEQILSLWQSGKPAVIPRSSFDRQLHRLVVIFRLYKRYGMPEHLVPLAEEERDKHLNDQFVEQLRLIEAFPDDVFDAIDDFVRCSTEKLRLGREGDLTTDDWEDFNSHLSRTWSNIFRRETRLNSTSSEEEVGYKIYSDTRETKASLAEVDAHQYLVHGTYHRLADQPERTLGWHPRFSDLLDSEKESE